MSSAQLDPVKTGDTANNHSPSETPIRDSFDRPMKSLRLSVTDRCNLACSYCMPEDGPDSFSAKQEILSYEELTELTRVFVGLGVDNVRITGGEPLLRNELHKLVALLKPIDGLNEISLTTNGYYLADHIDQLVDAGLDRINFSLDTLRKKRFEEISRRKGYDRVMEGLDALLNTPELHPVKLNAVAVRGFNDDELIDFADWAVKHGQHARFIEYMPLEGGADWEEGKVLLASEMRETVEEKYTLVPEQDDPHAPATNFQLEGTDGYMGFIPSVSNPFCGSCDRVRVTADGQVKNCLFAYDEDDLREALRSGAGRDKLQEIICSNYEQKWEGGCVKLARGEYEPDEISRTMSRIGG